MLLIPLITGDNLAEEGARASAAMILTYLAQNILVSVPDGFNMMGQQNALVP